MKPGEANKAALKLLLETIFSKDMVQCEYRFHPVRRWRFDYAIPEIKLAVEYHGHAGFQGRMQSGHSTIKGLTNDCEKMNKAISLGWRVLCFTALHFRSDARNKHSLSDPRTHVMDALAAMQEDIERIQAANQQPT